MTWQEEANSEQLNVFVSSYAPTWRLWMIHAIKVALSGRDDIRQSFQSRGDRGGPDEVSDSSLYGPITSGLYAAAIAESIMYAEDLFVLLAGLREPLTFVKRTVGFPGSKIVPLADKLERLSGEDVAKAMFVPTVVQLGGELDSESDAFLTAGSSILHLQVQEIIGWWKTHRFLQQQYKHGMSLALRPFSRSLPDETIKERKAGSAPPIYAYDREAINASTLSRSGGIIAHVGNGVAMAHAERLMADQNFLRYASHLPPVAFDEIIRIAELICDLQLIAIANRMELEKDAPPYVFWVPNANGAWLNITSTLQGPALADFKMKL